MYQVNIKCMSNKYLTFLSHFIIIKDDNTIIDKYSNKLSVCLDSGIYKLIVIPSIGITNDYYSSTLIVNKDLNINLYFCNYNNLIITLTDYYYPDLPIEKGEILIESNNN